MSKPDEVQQSIVTMGKGVGKEIGRQLIAREDFVTLMVEAAVGGLKAMTARRWDPEARLWVNDPDYRIRTATFFGLLAQMEGEPLKRVLNKVGDSPSEGGEAEEESLIKQLAQSPALRRKVANALARSQTRAEPVDLE